MTIPRWPVYVFSTGSQKLFDVLKLLRNWLKNETGSRIKCLRSNNGGEFSSDEFNKYCGEHGIKRQFLVARTPQQNGVVERKNRSVMEMARTMLNESKLNDKFLAQAVHTTYTWLTEDYSEVKLIKLPMSYGQEEQTCDTSKYLEASVTSKEKIRRLENLTLE